MFLEFYTEIYLYEFLDPNERETLGNMLDYLRKKDEGWYEDNNYHMLLLVNKETKQVIGGSISDYLMKPNCGVIEFIAIRKEHRRKGYAELLVNAMIQKLKQDATQSTYKTLDWIIGEVNNPKLTPKELETMNPYNRLKFWDKLNFKILDFNYLQPALGKDKEPVSNLMLMCNVLNPNWGSNEISSSILTDAIHEYARLAMRIPLPHKNMTVKRMKDEIKESITVSCVPIAVKH